MRTHFYDIGTPSRYSRLLSMDAAYRLIGAHIVAGFDTVMYDRTASGEPLTTRDGAPVMVVVLRASRGRVMSAVELPARQWGVS